MYYLKPLILLVIFCDMVYFGSAKSLPNWFKVCHRKDRKLNQCLKEAFQITFNQLKNGITELQIPSIDPLYVDDIRMSSGRSKAANLTQHYIKPKVLGLSDVVFTKAEGTMSDTNLNITVYFKSKKMGLYSKYEFDGQLTAVTITGNGDFTWEIYDTTFTCTYLGSTYQKKGITYMKLNDVILHFTPEKAFFNFTNLFGNEAVSNNINTVINENWYDVEKELQPSIEIAFNDIIKGFANNVFSKIPYDQLALPN